MASKSDPTAQVVTIHASDGTPIKVPLFQIDIFYQYCIKVSINYGAQLGACIAILVIMILLTRPEKRGSVVFVINCLALFFNAFRLICEVLYFTSGFVEVYAFLAHDYSDVNNNAYAISILGVVILSLVVVCVEVSLVLQVQVICSTLRRRYRRALLVVSIVIALVPIGFRFAYMVQNCHAIADTTWMYDIKWLERAATATTTISICFFCAIFVGKLGFAIKQRKRLGVREFGPMKIIFVMGCQTLFIPAIISILQYATNVPEIRSNVETLVTIFLPLSSIWAGVTLDQRNNGIDTGNNRRLWNMLSFTDSQKSRQLASMGSSPGTSNTCYSTHDKLHPDAEAGMGISVEREISLNTFKKEKKPVGRAV